MRFTSTLILSAALPLLLALAAPATAAPILVDFSATGVGASVFNPASDGKYKYWNSLGTSDDDVSATPLVDSSNGATGISMAIDVERLIAGGGAGFGGTGIAGPTGPDPFDEANAVTDGIYYNRTGGLAKITLTGLNNAYSYDFSAIGGRASSNGDDGTIEILTGNSSSTSYSLLNDGTVANFTVTPVGGEIVLNFYETDKDDVPADSATFNALSITEVVPEPSGFLLAATGLMGLALLRRRK